MLRFMRFWWLYLIISALVLVPGMYCLIRFGLKPSIDFTGGTLIEIKDQSADWRTKFKNEDIKKITDSQNIEVVSIQNTNTGSYIIRSKPLGDEQHKKFKDELLKQASSASEIRYETVGPTLGSELLRKTMIAAILAATAILLYVAYAFKNIRFGVSAVLALIHDVLIVVGIFAILGKVMNVEVDALFVTAVLTTMSFSVHDTIVVFDRIRESLKKSSGANMEELIDRALTETMGRSFNNSITIVFMLLALFLLGGETIKWFALALLIGTISGTYSSPFVATPILFVWHKIRTKK